MDSRRYDVALFDIDGTLCDPGTGITSAAAHALSQMGVTEVDPLALRRFVGPPLEHTFRDDYGFDESHVREAVHHYREHYASAGLSQYRAYADVEYLLHRLRDSGIRLIVVTAKIQPFAEAALLRTSLASHFESVHGRGQDDVVSKSVTLGRALLAGGVMPGMAVMIGDREHDVEAARDNGLESIGVLYGFGTSEELVGAGATFTAAAPKDVGDLILS